MKIALIGNQNCGKSTLFNCLTNSNVKIGNWPGVTIEKKTGIIKGTSFEIVDLPGIYSINPYSMEEEISKNYLLQEKPDLIVNVIDSTMIERSLYLTTQLLELNANVIIALNMIDILDRKGININVQMLSENLGVKVIPVSALRGTGIEELISDIKKKNTENEKRKECILKIRKVIERVKHKYAIDSEEAEVTR